MCAGVAGLNFGTHLKAVLGIDQHHPDIGHLKCRKEAAAEVVGTRSVDNIEFVSVVFGKQQCGIDRTFVDVFDVGEIGQGTVRFD